MPAYCPLLPGIQLIEKSGVVDDVKNVIAIAAMLIIESDDIGMEESLELAIAISGIVLVDDIGIDIDIEPVELDMDILVYV